MKRSALYTPSLDWAMSAVGKQSQGHGKNQRQQSAQHLTRIQAQLQAAAQRWHSTTRTTKEKARGAGRERNSSAERTDGTAGTHPHGPSSASAAAPWEERQARAVTSSSELRLQPGVEDGSRPAGILATSVRGLRDVLFSRRRMELKPPRADQRGQNCLRRPRSTRSGPRAPSKIQLDGCPSAPLRVGKNITSGLIEHQAGRNWALRVGYHRFPRWSILYASIRTA